MNIRYRQFNSDYLSAVLELQNEWFYENIQNRNLSGLYKAAVTGDALAMEEYLRDILGVAISFHDYAENYYHGVLTGLFSGMETHIARSNRESGLGRPDIVLTPLSVFGTVVIIVVKISSKASNMEKDALAALIQIEKQGYEAGYRADGFKTFVHCGVAFYKKDAVVRMVGGDRNLQILSLRA